MRHLARRLFTLCSAISLLLCVAVCVLWVRSYWVADIYTHVRRFIKTDFGNVPRLPAHMWRQFDAMSAGGVISITWKTVERPESQWLSIWERMATDGRLGLRSRPRGGEQPTYGFERDGSSWTVVVPHGFVAAATLVLPVSHLALLARRWRGRRRIASGKCPT